MADILLDLRVDTGTTAKELVQVENTLKKLKEQVKDNTISQAKFKEESVKLGLQKQKLNKQIKDEIKFNQALKGSNNELRSALSIVTANYNKLSKTQREGTAEGKKMASQIRQLTDKLKENESAVGDNRRNVGNYAEGVKQGIESTGLFGRELQVLRQIQTSVSTITQALTKQVNAQATAQAAAGRSSGVLTKAFRVLKVATLALPFVALATALAGVVSFFTKTQRGADALNKATAGLSAGFDVLVDRLSGAGEGLSLIFSGEFTKGFEVLSKQFKGIGTEIANESKAAFELEKRFQALEKAQISFIVTEEKLNNIIAEGEAAVNNADISLAKRQKLINDAIKANEELQKERTRLARENFEIVSAQVGLGESLNDELRAEKEAEAELIRIENTALKTVKRLLSAKKTLTGQANKAANATEKQADAQEKLTKKQEEADAKERERLEKDRLSAQEQLDDLEVARIKDLEERKIAELQRAFEKRVAKIGENSAEERQLQVELQRQLETDIDAVRKEFRDKESEEEKAKSEEQRGLRKQAFDDITNSLTTLATLNDKQNAAGQAAAKAANKLAQVQTTLALGQAAANNIKAITGQAALPFPSNLVAIASTVAAVTGALAGLKNVLTFQDGGLLSGPSHANGGIPFTVGGVGGFEAEGGEAIINKRSTKLFAPLLSAINSHRGFGKKFQDGGVVSSPISAPSISSSAGLGGILNTEQLAAQIGEAVSENTQVVLPVESLNETQNNVNIVENTVTF